MTQQEFLEIAHQKKWNLEKMRFFIGQKREEPKCFGVYQDGDEWVCYKNKANGQQVEHFRGKEEEAFQIIYDKVQSEIKLRVEKKKQQDAEKTEENGLPKGLSTVKKIGDKISQLAVQGLIGMVVVLIAVFFFYSLWDGYKHPKGYYLVDDSLYYQTSGDWYGYDDSEGWYYVDEPQESWYDYRYKGDTAAWDDGNTWESSTWAEQYQNDDTNDNNDDYDTDDYDTDDWDTGDTDWDSDW